MLRKDRLILETLPQESTIKQLKRIRKITKGTDIGDKLSNIESKTPNTLWFRNPIDTGIESYQDYLSSNRKRKKIKKFKEFD